MNACAVVIYLFFIARTDLVIADYQFYVFMLELEDVGLLMQSFRNSK